MSSGLACAPPPCDGAASTSTRTWSASHRRLDTPMFQPSTASDSPMAVAWVLYGCARSAPLENADVIARMTLDSTAISARNAQVRPRPWPITLLTARTRFRGTIRPAVVSALYCAPGTMTTLPLATSARQSRMTSLTWSHMNDGSDALEIPARSWNSVWTKPGHNACTPTPVPASPPASPSENDTTHALDAEYVDPRPDNNPATLATLMTVPAPAASMGGNAALVSCITAVTLTSSWACSSAGSAVQNSPEVPNPALFTRIRTPPASRSATLARSAASDRSAGSTSTPAPASSCSSAASVSSLSTSRATRTRSCPSTA